MRGDVPDLPMPGTAFLTPKQNDALLVLVGVILLASPAWVAALHVGEPTYHYERVQVVVDDEEGLTYARDDPEFIGLPISTEIGCSIPHEVRACAFERHLLDNHTVPTEVYTNNPDLDTVRSYGIRYRYVTINGTAYRSAQVPNRSVQREDGLYRVDLGLRRVPMERALRAGSLNATFDREQIPSAVYRAAVSGESTAPRRVDVPEMPIRLDDGEYYRVYYEERTEAPGFLQLLEWIFTYVGPLVGLGILIRVSGRVAVIYVGDDPGE
jgi:hypothetical protein